MRHKKSYNLLNWLLALLMVFAPMQAAVSAIDMLDHEKPQQHCQMGMDQQMDHEDSSQGDCCQNGMDCAKCVSVHAMMFSPFVFAEQKTHSFQRQLKSLAKGIPAQSQFRPPRSFS